MDLFFRLLKGKVENRDKDKLLQSLYFHVIFFSGTKGKIMLYVLDTREI